MSPTPYPFAELRMQQRHFREREAAILRLSNTNDFTLVDANIRVIEEPTVVIKPKASATRTLSQPPLQLVERESSQHSKTGATDDINKSAGYLGVSNASGIATDTEERVEGCDQPCQEGAVEDVTNTAEDKPSVEVGTGWTAPSKSGQGGASNKPKVQEAGLVRICVEADKTSIAQDGMATGTEQRASIAQVTEQYYELLEESDVEDWRQLLQDIETLSPESR
jgi:hypothetical protein